ncbi:Cytochrome c oxidase subunit 5A [Thelotrema lepadinum]|nr:Cytochrome c oxidase subunit 5A [Thelotrema lepadinum]
MAGVGISFVLFFTIRAFAGEAPRTMNKEWQQATDEYLKSQNVEPITGISSEGYKGTMVQSK